MPQSVQTSKRRAAHRPSRKASELATGSRCWAWWSRLLLKTLLLNSKMITKNDRGSLAACLKKLLWDAYRMKEGFGSLKALLGGQRTP